MNIIDSTSNYEIHSDYIGNVKIVSWVDDGDEIFMQGEDATRILNDLSNIDKFFSGRIVNKFERENKIDNLLSDYF